MLKNPLSLARSPCRCTTGPCARGLSVNGANHPSLGIFGPLRFAATFRRSFSCSGVEFLRIVAASSLGIVCMAAAEDSISFPFKASIRSQADVNLDFSNDSAMAARMGFKSTYMQQANKAASSMIRWARKRPCQKAPVQSSWRLAIRAMGSERAFMNQEISDKRLRIVAIRRPSFTSLSTSLVVGSPSCSSIRLPGKI
jgi:hypothetical protein